MATISYAQVSALLKYDPDTGLLFWLPRPVEMFSDAFLGSEWSSKRWNTRYAGKEAFTALDGRGYRYGQIYKKPYRAHRVAWLLTHGVWPEGEIDHINGVRTDNRLANLRDVSITINRRNCKLRSDNKSGVSGVNWNKAYGKWRARIAVNGQEVFLGNFDCVDDAIEARKQAEKTVGGFHKNHGRAS